MAEQQTILEINVDASRAVAAIQEYNEQLAEVNKRLEEAREVYGENSKEVITLTAKQKLLNDQIRRMNTEVKNEIQQSATKKDSIVALRAEYNKLKQQYVEMSAEERKTAGKETLDRMKALYGQISELEQSYGVFSRNVGNYNNKIVSSMQDVNNAAGAMGASSNPVFKAMTSGLNGVNGALKLIYANPIIALIGVLAGILMAVANAISKNEELTNRMRVAMAPLQLVMDAVANLLDRLASGLVSFIELLTKGIGKILDFVGATNGASAAVADYNKQIKEEISLEKERRKQVVSNAKGEYELAKMKDKLAKTNKKDYKSRKEQLTAIISLEERLSKQDVELAQREFDLAKAKADRAPNDKAANDELAQSEAKLYQAKTKYFNDTLEYSKKLTEIDQQRLEAQKAAANKRKELLKKQAEEAERARKAAYDAEMQGYADARKRQLAADTEEIKEMKRQSALRIAQMQENGAKEAEIEAQKRADEKAQREVRKMQIQNELLNAQEYEYKSAQEYEQRMADLKSMSADLDVEIEQARVAEILRQRKELADKSLEIEKAHNEAKTALQNSYNALMQTSLGKSKAAVATQKILATAQVAMNAGKAISEAIASASSGDPYTIALRVASAVASVTAAIAKAKDAVSSASFSTGGYVSGAGTATSDSIHARLSNGESVMNARSTAMYAPLLSALNQSGGGAPINAVSAGNSANNSNYLAQQFAMALTQMPNPVVSVTEFAEVSNRVQSIESAAAF